MTTTRKSKIAHLPHRLREDLNQRLHDGVPGHKILAWLNAEPDTQRILAEYYRGQCITQQNLSVWRQGGYQDWVKLQHRDELILALAQDPEAIDLGIRPQKITESMATIAIAEFARASQERSRECITTDERWKHCCQVQSQLSRFREDSRRADVAALQKEQWDYQVATDLETTKRAAEAKVRHELLTELNRIMNRFPDKVPPANHPSTCPEGRVTRVHNIVPSPSINPPIQKSNDPVPQTLSASGSHQASIPQKPVENAHFPSKSNLNHAPNISSPSTSPAVPARNPRSLQPAVQPSKNHAETAHFPSRTKLNQAKVAHRAVALAKAETNSNLNHARKFSTSEGRVTRVPNIIPGLSIHPPIHQSINPSRIHPHQPTPHGASNLGIPTLDLSLPLPISIDRPIAHITGAYRRHPFKAPTTCLV